MLFWAVDNPAPGNYLLISGDRDFSNALHQLRMRRYNILLAQPHTASASLLAAAKSVWLWTGLMAGGPPIANGGSPQNVDNSYGHVLNSSPLHVPVTEPIHMNQPVDNYYGSAHMGNQKFPNMERGTDSKQKGKPLRKPLSQPSTMRTSSPPDQNIANPHQSGYMHSSEFKDTQELPYVNMPNVSLAGMTPNHIPGGTNFPWTTSNNPPNYQIHHSQSEPTRLSDLPTQPVFAPGNVFPPNPHARPLHFMPSCSDGPRFSSGPPTNVPDISKLNFSDYPTRDQNGPIPRPWNGGQLKQNSIESLNDVNSSQKAHSMPKSPFYQDAMNNSRYPSGCPDTTASSSSAMDTANIAGNGGIWSTPGCPKPSEYIQGLIGVILLALNTLKSEKIMPTEANIIDCIRFGDRRRRNTDVKKALESAAEQQLVVKQNLGALPFYVGKNEKLWKCMNPISTKLKQHSKATWDELQKLLTSPAGRSAIIASKCR